MAQKSHLQLGKEMWLIISPTFHQVAADNGITTQDQFVSLWAGFLAGSCGAMTADVGPDYAAALLDEIKKSVAIVSRSKLTAVKS